MEWIEKLVSPLGEGFKWLPETPPGKIKDSVIKFSVTSAYFRAIAKIAFHYLLATNSYFTGAEQYFEAIKNFIYLGNGNYEQFIVQERSPIIATPGLNYRPNVFCHIIVIEVYKGFIQARVQFFFGPRFNPPVYRIKIAEKFYLIQGFSYKGHCFAYYPDGQKGKYHGEASELLLKLNNESGNGA